jgi:hypothetical protein
VWTDLEDTLKVELREDAFARWLCACQQELNIPKKKHAMKNPVVVARILDQAQEEGKHSETLEAIVSKVIALKYGNGDTYDLHPAGQGC